jgi:hypothetical protein
LACGGTCTRDEGWLALLQQVYAYKNIATKMLKEKLLGEMGMQ